MQVTKWHPGKIALLWLGEVALFFILRSAAPANRFMGDRGVLGMSTDAFVFFLLPTIVLLWVTWKWLSGREPRGDDA